VSELQVEILPLRALLALQTVLIEILGQVAGYALAPVPERRIYSAHACVADFLVNFVAGTGDADAAAIVEVVVVGAGETLLAVEVGTDCRAVGALAFLEVVDLTLGAGEALLDAEVEIFGEVAGDASEIVPEVVNHAFAFVCSCVVVLGERAAVTGPVSLVEVSFSLAGSANLPIEKGSDCWTIHTLLLTCVVDLMIRTEDALKL
jgi:hypothetical protein